ncbi:MAG: sulfite exporter TauE/SafE family protein [Alphaproteobacteria bacterium]|nr:sulfite exporter TauE/SafE family protein [Alphaproteobacteria bacterium]
MLLGWDASLWAFVAGACVVAGVVRGFTGFGFPLIVVTASSLVIAPAEIVPIALLLDILAGLRLLPHVRADVDRRGATLLILSAAPMIPIGAYLLASIDPDVMRLAIGIMVLIAVIALARGLALSRPPNAPLLSLTGVVAGFLSGVAGMPGPPVILLYLSSPLPVATLRATAIAFFLFTDVVALLAMSYYGLIGVELLWRAAVLAPLVEVAVFAGRKLYGVAEPSMVKQAALVLLALLAASAIARSMF